ncbi:hypothetical protein Tco_0542419 [Tanacetum coccineum]
MDFNMPEVPPNNRGTHHRRAQSETFYRFTDDDILLDDVVADFNFASIDLPPSLNTNNNGESSSKSESESCEVGNGGSRPPLSHVRSLSVDGGFFEGLGLGFGSGGGGGGHVRSNSMDGSVTSSFDGFGGLDNSKKALAPEKLAELALTDPKRAKSLCADTEILKVYDNDHKKVLMWYEVSRKIITLHAFANALSVFTL